MEWEEKERASRYRNESTWQSNWESYKKRIAAMKRKETANTVLKEKELSLDDMDLDDLDLDGLGLDLGLELDPELDLDDFFNETLVVTTLMADGRGKDDEEKKNPMSRFTRECLGSGALDSACNSKVCGQLWMRQYINALSKEQRKKVEKTETLGKSFIFGDMGLLKTRGTYKIPAVLAGKECRILVDSWIPLLLSNACMSKAKMVIDYGTNEVKIAITPHRSSDNP